MSEPHRSEDGHPGPAVRECLGRGAQAPDTTNRRTGYQPGTESWANSRAPRESSDYSRPSQSVALSDRSVSAEGMSNGLVAAETGTLPLLRAGRHFLDLLSYRRSQS